MLGSRLDRLADAFEAHGVEVRGNLRPGASAAELDAVEAALGVRLPQAYRDLYAWSAGCIDPDRDPALQFRDNTFLPLDRVVEIQRRVIETYGLSLEGEPALEQCGVDFATTAPLAEFMGSTYVVACGDHRLKPATPHPVIGVFQGIDVYFLSIETMVETCIEWVEQPDYRHHQEAPRELEIWQKHNPGVFQ